MRVNPTLYLTMMYLSIMKIVYDENLLKRMKNLVKNTMVSP